MTDSNRLALMFSNLGGRRIQADFGGGKVTSDAGAEKRGAVVGFEGRGTGIVSVSPYNFGGYLARSSREGKAGRG